jgi:hypothetical protein
MKTTKAIRPEYILEIEELARRKLTRRELRRLFWRHTEKQVPPGVNLRFFVARVHADQQAINAGFPPTPLWRRAHGLIPS